jgi:hypothetical protein
LTGAGIAVSAIAGALSVAAIASAILLFLAYARSEERGELRDREKRAADARVLTVSKGGDGGRRRLVSYRFAVDGRHYVGRTLLRERDRRPVAPGRLLSIEYIPSHPNESWIVGYVPGRFPIWPILVVPIALLIAAMVAATSVRRQWTLLSEGRIAQAQVTAHKRVHVGEHKGFRVSSDFRTLSGALHAAHFPSQKAPPPIGSVVPIVYHRDDPTWHALYPLRLVRPVHVRSNRRRGLKFTA